ncbi:MAG: transglutaminase domain-containing protein [Clostridiales bacterium]
MSKRKRFISFRFLFVSFIVCALIVFALKYNSESEGVFNAEVINFGKFTYPKKEWKVKLSKNINIETLNNDGIYIENSNGEKHNVKLLYSKRDRIVTIKPIEKYLAWEKYSIVITDKIKTDNGEKLVNPFKLNFDMLENTYKSGLEYNYCEFKPTGIVNTEEDFYNELKFALDNFEKTIKLKLNNSDKNEYNIDILNEICDDIPLLNYGFKSIKGETVKDSFGNEKITIEFEYRLPIEELKEMKKKSKLESEKIINNLIKPEMSDIQKELAVHNYLINNCVYDRGEKEYPAEDYTDYGVYVNKLAVCEGYSKAMYRILNKLDIRCIYIVGQAKMPHAWNIVEIDNEYYQVDVTWNDMPSIDEGEILVHKYFNITSADMAKNHEWKNSNYPICNSEKFTNYDFNQSIIYSDENVENIKIIENKNQFENGLKEAIINKKEKIVFKILDYSKNNYDVEKSIQNIVNNNNFNFYGKFSYTHPSELEDGAVEYVEVIFKKF